MEEDHKGPWWEPFVGVLTLPAAFGVVIGAAFIIANWNSLQITVFKADWSLVVPAWFQAVGSIAAVIGAWIISRSEYRRQTEAKHTAASYEIAVQLKQWIEALETEIRDAENAEPRPDGGTDPFVIISDLPFETALGRVAELKPRHARAVFDLISEKQASNRTAHDIIDFADPDEASEHTFQKLEAIYPDAIALCNTLEAFVGWEKTEASSGTLKVIKKNAGR